MIYNIPYTMFVFVLSDVCAKFDMSDTVYETYDASDICCDVTKLYRTEIGVKRSTYGSYGLSY